MYLSFFNKIKNKIPNTLCILSIILFFYILFFVCNIVHSGYKLHDDHEIYYFSSFINKDTFWGILKNFFDTDGRFRPIHDIHRVIVFYLFKANFFLYYLEYFILGVISGVLLFFISKRFLSSFASLLITIFTLFSCEYNIYWGLGFGELLCCTLLITTLFFIFYPIKRFNTLKNILFFIFFVLTIYSKETFLIAGPFILAIKILYDSKDTSIKQSIRNNLFHVIFISFFIILGLILNIVENGHSNNYTVILKTKEVFASLFDILCAVKYLTIEYIMLFVLSIIGYFLIKKEEKSKYLNYILIGALLLLSQLLFLSLFSKDNTFQIRYLFPAYFAGTIILTTLFFYIKNKIFQIILYIFLLISTIYNMQVCSLQNIKYSSDLNILFNKTISNTQEILSKDDNILLIGDAVVNMEYF